jgi:hypothetical protein
MNGSSILRSSILRSSILRSSILLPCAAAAFAAAATAASTPNDAIPRLERRDHATQLIVDGRPFLLRGAELRGTASSNLTNMESIWPELVRLNLNTALLALGWDWIEPREGQFDFSLVDGLIAGARRNHQRLVFLWFGTWKNGISSFVPEWVKADSKRFPRVRLRSGDAVEIVSPFSRAALDADTRAYVKLLEHLREVDAEHTVLMIQLENEVGMSGDTRDRGAAALEAFAKPVPDALLRYLRVNEAHLSPELQQRWRERGALMHGDWTAVFGDDTIGGDIFMAWHYAQYLNHISAAGKAVYALPVFTNTALAEPWSRQTHPYPAGGPQYFLLDVWKAGAPSIDFNSPDVYSPNFADIVANFHRPDNPLFIPESAGDAHGIANAYYAVGAHAAIGYSPFGVDDTAWLINFRPDKGAAGTNDVENTPLARGYAVLRELAPAILEAQARGAIDAAWLNPQQASTQFGLGDYTVKVELRRSTRDQAVLADLGYGLVMAVAANEFIVSGSDIQVTFEPRTPGPPIAGIASAELGTFEDGRWVSGRKVNGDDILLNYDLAGQAALHQSGSGLRFLPGPPVIQRVRLYRYP